MFNFFRRIRKNLFTEKQFSRYFTYAIGEIFLVVIGILIALQINNWNEGRKNRIEEQALLSQLQSEFVSNLGQLNEKIDIRKDMITASFKLLDYIKNPEDITNDSIVAALTPTILLPTFDPIINDINSSGRIQLLGSTRLKELLALWTSEVVAVKEEETRWNDYSLNYYTPFIIEYASYRDILNSYWESNTINTFHLDKGTRVKFNIQKSERHPGHSDILRNSDLEDHLAFCLTMSKVANTQSESLRKRIMEILELIEKDLK